MKSFKTVKLLIIGSVIALSSFSVSAACGDSECGWVNGEFRCVAEYPGGEKRVCTVTLPCNINCNP